MGAVAAGAVAVLAAALALSVLLNLAAHVARYRDYRRSYPAAPRGRVWRHTR